MVTAVRFSNGQEALSIVYSGAKYVRSALKIAAAQNHFFVWLKTGNFSNACGTVTLKSPPPQAFSESDVHQRLRKRLARCTLDCGFKTPESPALRGFVAERGPITGTSLYLVLKSNGLRHPKNLPVKFGFSPINTPANIVKKLPPQRCPQPFLIPLFNFSHKRPTFAFTGERGAFRTGVVSLHSERSTRFGNPAWPGFKTANFADFVAWSWVLPKNAESLRSSDALMRVAVPRRRGPAGLRDPVSALLIMW